MRRTPRLSIFYDSIRFHNSLFFLFKTGTQISPLSAEQLSKSLAGKNILVVGETAGIGKAIAESCIAKGATVTIVGRRDPAVSLSAATFIKADLALLKTCKALVPKLKPEQIDIAIFTTGIIANAERQVTSEGIEKDLAVSYLSRYTLIEGMLAASFGEDRSDKDQKARIFIMGM
jgi:NAD(P)-dependent dehydrogenase (short-subunit alcohol dehydrogenase family)